jgi:hypothetical protein
MRCEVYAVQYAGHEADAAEVTGPSRWLTACGSSAMGRK